MRMKMGQKNNAFQTTLSSQLYCILTDVLDYARWKKTLFRFSLSPSMHNRSLSEQRFLKARRTPEAAWGFLSWKTRKCFHLNAESIWASRDILGYAAPLTEEVMPGQTPWADIVQLMAQRIITHKLTVSDLIEGLLVLLPSLEVVQTSTASELYLYYCITIYFTDLDWSHR